MFSRAAETGYTDPLPGIRQKTLVHGERTLMTEFRLQRDAVLPDHQHPHEQTGYLVSGHLRLHLGEDWVEVRAGDSWCIPPHVVHGAQVIADAVAVEVFAPVREDYLPR